MCTQPQSRWVTTWGFVIIFKQVDFRVVTAYVAKYTLYFP